MANEDPNALATILRFAENYLKRPLTVVERQVLEAFVQNKSVDLAQASQNSVDQARQLALGVIQADEQRTRQLIDQLSGHAAPSSNPQTRDLLLQQLLSAAGAQAQGQAPTSPPPAQVQGPVPTSPPPAPADDPALKAMISSLVQQEVKAAIEARMAELAQKVEDTLKQVTSGSGQ